MMVEYHWLEGQPERRPSLIADLVRRRVAVIVTPNTGCALAAKAATTTIPIVSGVGEDPVRLGLVASLARPGGNATSIHFVAIEVVAKRLELHRVNPLHPQTAAHGKKPPACDLQRWSLEDICSGGSLLH
jgi:putative ABC transport system substrate-binding protein